MWCVLSFFRKAFDGCRPRFQRRLRSEGKETSFRRNQASKTNGENTIALARLSPTSPPHAPRSWGVEQIPRCGDGGDRRFPAPVRFLTGSLSSGRGLARRFLLFLPLAPLDPLHPFPLHRLRLAAPRTPRRAPPKRAQNPLSRRHKTFFPLVPTPPRNRDVENTRPLSRAPALLLSPLSPRSRSRLRARARRPRHDTPRGSSGAAHLAPRSRSRSRSCLRRRREAEHRADDAPALRRCRCGCAAAR